jgi:trans-aconitate 2-methyltransferase
VLAALADRAEDFLAEYGTRIREAYSPNSFGTVFPFRRVFTVAHRAS